MQTSFSVAALLAGRTAVSVAAEPTIRDTLSGSFGCVSLIAWICLTLPQLIQNYKLQSADGLSMAFLLVWLVGDLANLSGALWTKLNPAAVMLACYFCISDVVLTTQCSYYNAKTARRNLLLQRSRTRRRSSSTAVDIRAGGAGAAVIDDNNDISDESPLLVPRRRSSSIGLPGSHVRRHSSHQLAPGITPLRRVVTGEDDANNGHLWQNNVLSLAAVWIVGILCYWATTQVGAWGQPNSVAPGISKDGRSSDGVAFTKDDDVYAAFGLGLGYFSAVCYLCARIPQIYKNYQERSCEGLSPLFFLLSLTGNFTYGASLLSASPDRDHLLTALPWLLGSLGTIVEDMVIFFQFRLYAPRHDLKPSTRRVASDSSVAGVYGAT